MANEHVGRRREIAWTKETQRGTAAVAQSGDWYPNEAFDFKPVTQKVEDTSALGSIVMREGADIVREYSQGSVSFVLYDSMLTSLSNMITGSDGSLVGSTTTFTLANTNIHQSYTISTSDPVSGDKAYPLAVLNTFTLTGATEEYVKGTAEFYAGKEESVTLTPAYSTTAQQFVADGITVKLASNYSGLGSANASVIKNFQLNIEKNVDFDFALGSTEPVNIYNQGLAISGQFTLTYNTTTMRTLGLSETNNAISIALSNGEYRWTFELPSCDFGDWTPSTEGDSYVTETVSFFANYADKTNGFVKVLVTEL